MKVLLNEGEIRAGVRRLADEITDFYRRKRLTIVGVMTGSLVLVADLIRQLDLPLQVGSVQARSYRGRATSPGALTVNAEFLPLIKGRDVLIVDDIFDTGHTLFELISHLDGLAPASVRSAVLLLKQGRQKIALRPHHVGFEIPDTFVVGYGLDYNDLYRNLPYVAILESGDVSEAPE